MIQKDCSGLACPQPVLDTRELITANPAESVEIIVDNEAARQNVTRFLESQGYGVTVQVESERRIIVKGEPGACVIEAASAGSDAQKILVFIPTDCLGQGDTELGRKLMLNFIKTLSEFGQDLWRIVLVNSGVKLSIEGADTLSALQTLEKAGVSILVCGTCLEFYELMDKKGVGQTTNMLDIVTSMHLATKVVRV